jgi:predicted outer membrane repeat protein
MAVDDLAVTCIKLAPVVYAPLSTLRIFGPRLAIVADDGQATLDGGGKVQLMYVALGADVALANLRLRNGNVTKGGGGAIYNDGGTMKVLTCTFDHNFAKTGGAIYNDKGTMEIQACVFDRNHAKLDGGALFNDRGTIKIQSCAFDNHHAGQDGGAVVLFEGTMEMHGCNITNCSAEVLPLPRSATSLR